MPDRRGRGKRWQQSSLIAAGIQPQTIRESDIQRDVLAELEKHPLVAWAKRMNVGAGFLAHEDKKTGEVRKGRFIRFAFKGCSDIVGQLTNGRFLAVECKKPGGRATEDQTDFLTLVNQSGGVGFIARSPADVDTHLTVLLKRRAQA